MSSQLQRWQGDFGVAYTDRNEVDWQTRVAFFRDVIPLDVWSILEVGPNRGHNLLALAPLKDWHALVGLEPQPYALTIARSNGLDVEAGDIYDIPWGNDQFDLAFTCGVLIHVPPERLDDALREMHRVTRRYLLAIEYPASTDTPVPYRGHDDMLWKRPISDHYQRLFPNLQLIGCADLTADDGLADSRYWLLEKT